MLTNINPILISRSLEASEIEIPESKMYNFNTIICNQNGSKKTIAAATTTTTIMRNDRYTSFPITACEERA